MHSRTRLLVFLLVLLPLQLCWAAVGAYCKDEGPGSLPPVAMHCCEHAQLRDGAMDESTRAGDAAPSVDCGSCHLQGTEAFQAQRDLEIRHSALRISQVFCQLIQRVSVQRSCSLFLLY